MSRTIVVVGTLLCCACGGGVFGSFVQGHAPLQAAMAADAAKKLAAQYEPAGRTIAFGHEATDVFGRSLAAELRKVGFGVREPDAERAERELSVRYVVDAVKGTELCRLTLYVERRTLARAYLQRAHGVHPAGPWSVGGP